LDTLVSHEHSHTYLTHALSPSAQVKGALPGGRGHCVLRDDRVAIRACIKAAWAAIASEAAALGTAMHRDIELHLNEQPVHNESPEFGYALDYIEYVCRAIRA
jgi:hypothetical protein